MARNVGILGVGFSVPPTVITNEDLVQRHGPFFSQSGKEVGAESIFEKTGILQRHIVTTEDNSDLAVEAAIRIVEDAKIAPELVDCCILASSTPSMFFPATACLTQQKLHEHFPFIRLFPSFDLLAACSGSVYALIIAKALVSDGTCKYVLVIGSEVLSKIIRWQYRGDETVNGQRQRGDWETSSLFGDGAAGVLIGEVGVEFCARSGIVAVDWGADGSLSAIARSDGFGTAFPGVREEMPHIYLRGYDMYRAAVPAMVQGAENVLKKSGLSWDDISLVIPHQANGRMTQKSDELLQQKGLPPGRVYSNIERYGNTSTASTFIALAEKRKNGEIREGSYIIITTAGSGITWASVLFKW